MKVAQLCLTLCDPTDYIVHGFLQAIILEWVNLSLLQGIELRSPALQADSLPAEPQGSPRILEWVAYPFGMQVRKQLLELDMEQQTGSK